MAITRFNAKNGLSVGTGSIGVVDSEGNVEAKNVGVTGSITPDASGLYDIGSPTKVWRNLYVSNISGSLTGSNVTAGQVVVAGTGGVLSGSNNFWWDNTNGRVGIGTSAPQKPLEVITAASDFVSVGVRQLTLNQWTGIHFGYRESNNLYRKSAIVFERTDNPTAAGKIHILNASAATSTANAALSDARITITDTGNVGVGGSNPTARLTVTGSTADNTADALHVLNSSNGSMLYVRNDGLVGVGTSSSTARFQVQGSATATTPTMIVREGVASPTGGAGTFDVQNSAGTSLLFVSGSGNIGVGTTTPGFRLTVVQGASGNTAQFTNGANADLLISLTAGVSLITPATGILALGTTSTERMRINSSGNIGIGTTTYTARLFVSGSSTASTPTMVVREGVASPTEGVGMFDVQSSGGVSHLFVSASGNVGVGTNVPLGKLQVSGSSTGSTTSLLVRHGVLNGSNLPVLDAQNSAGTSLFFISGSGNVGIGTTTFLTNNRAAVFSATPTSTFDGQLLLSSDTASSAAESGAQINFQMYDGTSYRGAVYIKGAKENSTSGNYGTILTFGTRTNGSTSITERMRIDSNGNTSIGYNWGTGGGTTRLFVSGSSNPLHPTAMFMAGTPNFSAGNRIIQVLNSAGSELFYVTGSGDVGINNGNLVIGTSGKGIDFGATTNSSGSLSSEVLDDYERGTWTPGIATGGGSITLNATISRGVYVKIGRMVWIGGTVRSSAISSPTGVCAITGLPFTSDTWNSGQTVYLSFLGEFFSSTGLTAWAHTGGTVFQNSNEIDMFRYTTSAVYSDQVAANWDASCEFAFTFCYNANV